MMGRKVGQMGKKCKRLNMEGLFKDSFREKHKILKRLFFYV